ncbi:MAG: DUF1329 domain-containing protein [Parvibaculaceae bacterium]|nr:DUF1329 domain-containing protein [Parvibaculaceae bacterium]
MFDIRYSSMKRAATVVSVLVGLCSAGAPAVYANGFGADKTPIGATRAGNAEGTIPPWEGGLTQVANGWKPGDARVDPFADEKSLFTISADNVDQYKDKLTPGQVALLKQYPGYTMPVYKTHRTCALPERNYQQTVANLSGAVMNADNKVEAGFGGVLFPQPKTGWEAMMNHRTAYSGVATRHMITTAVKKTNGSNKIYKGEVQAYSPIYDPDVGSIDAADGFLSKFVYTAKLPTKSAGTTGLVHEFFNKPRNSWAYLPGLRRVKMAPNIAYDNPSAGQDGLTTFDQSGMFNGEGDRYNWELQGKQEIYVPYNAWKFRNKSLSVDDIVGEMYPTRELTRYELHRVWKVKATLRDDYRNIFTRRDFYLDEDSWRIVAADLYDARGELWRVQESHLFVAPELPACVGSAEFYYDLVAQRYVADSLIIGDDENNYTLGSQINGNQFSPAYLRRHGRR